MTILKNIGTGGDYADFNAALNDLAGSDMTLTQISAVSQTTACSTHDYGGKIIQLLNPNGYITSVSGLGRFYLGNFFDYDYFTLDNLIIQNVDVNNNIIGISLGAYGGSVRLHNLKIFGMNLNILGDMSEVGINNAGHREATTIEANNVLIYNCSKAGIIDQWNVSGGVTPPSVPIKFWQNIVCYKNGIGLYCPVAGAPAYASYKNISCSKNTTDYSVATLSTLASIDNCADGDNTLTQGSNNIRGVTDADYVTVDPANANFLKINTSSKLANTGDIDIASWNDMDMDGDPRPNGHSLVSIGFDEIFYPEIPVLISPKNNSGFSKNFQDTVRLVWTSLATTDRVQVSTDPSFSTTILNTTTTDKYYDLSTPDNGVYYWRVAVVAGTHDPTWSDVWLFKLSLKYIKLIASDDTFIRLNLPCYGYETEIHMPITISDVHPGGFSFYDPPDGSSNLGTFDYRILSTAKWLLPASQKTDLNTFIRSSSKGRAQNFTLSLGSIPTGFFPFGPDLGDLGDFTIRLIEQKQGGMLYAPLKQWQDNLSFVLVSSPLYTADSGISQGKFQIGSVFGLLFPQNTFNPEYNYDYQTELSRSGIPNSIDGREASDTWVCSWEQQANAGKTAALISFLTGVYGRTADITILSSNNFYVFGIDNGDSGNYTCKFLGSSRAKNELVLKITHDGYNQFTIPLTFYMKQNNA
jgi:hypothetical protein